MANTKNKSDLILKSLEDQLLNTGGWDCWYDYYDSDSDYNDSGDYYGGPSRYKYILSIKNKKNYSYLYYNNLYDYDYDGRYEIYERDKKIEEILMEPSMTIGDIYKYNLENGSK